MGPKVPHSTVLSAEEELLIVEFRRHTLLPLDDCLTFLKKNGGARGLNGTAEEIDAVLKEFARRVHRIPLALVWAIGYLDDTKFTLKQVLKRRQLFADFDREQAKDAERYENLGAPVAMAIFAPATATFAGKRTRMSRPAPLTSVPPWISVGVPCDSKSMTPESCPL